MAMTHKLNCFAESRRQRLPNPFIHYISDRGDDDESPTLIPLTYVGALKRRHSFSDFVRHELTEFLQAPVHESQELGKLLMQKMLDGLRAEKAKAALSSSPFLQPSHPVKGKAIVTAPQKSIRTDKDTVTDPFQAESARSAASMPTATAGAADDEITTWLIHNLPIELDTLSFVDVLKRSGYERKFNFCWLPAVLGSKCSKGHAFLNFVSSKDAKRFKQSWQGQWIFDQQQSPLVIKVASVQGLQANVDLHSQKATLRKIRNPHLKPWVALNVH
eukprot:TRINITY_DN111306_c0_g1_i1.p1 TRINITY_DN111306_c0_g1~~TRINITY_DN111306_c0_g1_i1.p1  ORF type:complete len:274 (-),score=42.29 TRINITY_DN111306_c0_g1_i1:100-921(-)